MANIALDVVLDPNESVHQAATALTADTEVRYIVDTLVGAGGHPVVVFVGPERELVKVMHRYEGNALEQLSANNNRED